MENTEEKVVNPEEKVETSEERIERMLEEDIKRMKENESLESATISSDEELSWVRSTRNQILSESDWTQLPDVPKEVQELWKDYRQQLRDLPSNFKDSQSITWPKPPSSL
jgi:septation ring formation regulator EzrA